MKATYADIGTVELYFTTVDGSSTKFSLNQDLDNSILFTGEVVQNDESEIPSFSSVERFYFVKESKKTLKRV